jgi:hypothetical protein
MANFYERGNDSSDSMQTGNFLSSKVTAKVSRKTVFFWFVTVLSWQETGRSNSVPDNK